MSETVKHTPGPWFALEKSGPNVARVVSEEGNNIAFLSAMNGRSKDDCHLISAAPDLYWLAIELESYFQQRADADMDQDGYVPNEEMRILANIKSAIARAEGSS